MPTTTEYFALLVKQVRKQLDDSNVNVTFASLEPHFLSIECGEPSAINGLYRWLVSSVEGGALGGDEIAPVLSLLSENRERYAYLSDLCHSSDMAPAVRRSKNG